MPSFSNLTALHGYGLAALALAVAAAVGLAVRISGRNGPGRTGAGWPTSGKVASGLAVSGLAASGLAASGMAGAAGALAGWALLPGVALQSVWVPRTVPDHLLLPAAAALAAALASPWLRGRAGRWMPAVLALAVGWWVAGSAPARPEFWRVWATVAAAVLLLPRLTGPGGAQSAAVAASLAVGLLAAGAPPVWVVVATVAAGAAVGAWATGGAIPATVLVVAAAVVDLGAGRLVRAGFNGMDLACILPPLAALMTPAIGARLGRLGRTAQPAAVAAAAALVGAAAYIGARAIR